VDRKQHWERVYSLKSAQEVSWYQAQPDTSLTMIRRAAAGKTAAVIDIGGGASRLVDCLLKQGCPDLTVLDISGKALEQARDRLGPLASRVAWIEADVTAFEPTRTWDVWHDRAAFHFLTDAADRERYLSVLNRALAAGGQVIIAAFAIDGPQKCSGLDVERYDAAKLAETLGPGFALEESCPEIHLTPAGGEQRFGFHRFRRNA
jgi:SAM-dependent methyltransferase